MTNTDVLEVGKWSYKEPVIKWAGNSKVKIGNFCSIAHGVEIFLGGDHRTDWVTTFPFMSFYNDWPSAEGIQGHPRSKGDVVIGNDVWIGADALILSGVAIGDGAVVGARAVVAKDVPPYAIVIGNPAKIVKYRFSEEVIEKLLAIAWWNWDDSEIQRAMPYLLCDDIQAFIQYCESIGR